MKMLLPFKVWIIVGLIGILFSGMTIFSVQENLESYSILNSQKLQTKALLNIDSTLFRQKKYLNEMNQFISENQSQRVKIENSLDLATYIERICDKYSLQTLIIPRMQKEDFESSDSTKERFEFSLKGNYTNILQAIYQIEHKDRLGTILQLHFEKQKVRIASQKLEILTCQVLLEKHSFPYLGN